MSAGAAYVLDGSGDFPGRVNPELVELERLVEHDRVARIEDEQMLRSLVAEHCAATGSAHAADILNQWQEHLPTSGKWSLTRRWFKSTPRRWSPRTRPRRSSFPRLPLLLLFHEQPQRAVHGF